MSKEFQKPEMVNWYDPRQLKDTGKRTLISTIIGENADPRLVASLASRGRHFDYSKQLVQDGDDFKTVGEKPRDEIWIDYVSDVGDGWNSTYAVAYSLAKENLKVPDAADSLKRGNILVFGGDQVYPTATSNEYEKRFITPYKMAFKANLKNPATKLNKSEEVDLDKEPHVFALPGNHDWYDSLVAFQKVFCTFIFNKGIFADAWRTRQEISYFALKLPHNWWLFGVDLQLSHNIDGRQLQYFEKVVKDEMEAGDKIILCVPEPFWVKSIKYQDITDIFEEKEKSIEILESKIKEKGIEIKLYLAGDLHHYRRFESDDGNRTQKITAGGGGAFLHPTHDFDFEKKKVRKGKSGTRYSFKKNYPSSKESSKHDWKNLYKFLWNNKTFGFLTAGIYIILAFLTNGKVVGDFTWVKAFRATINRVIEEPLALFVVILLLLGLVFFTDSNSKIYRRTAGTIHGLLHLAAIFVLGWLAYILSNWVTAANYLPESYNSLIWFITVVLVCGLGGYIIGSFLMGLYLFVSLHFFGRHDNEAFSALKIEDYKNFIRLHIDTEGKLTIYPLKIEEVPRNWTPVKEGDEIVTYQPKEKIEPELIEKIDPID